jgi:endonuclease/exonuclease/phosphatase family metal-dependent hydrolase
VVCDFLRELTDALAECGGSYDVCAVNHNFAGSGAGLSLRGSNVILARTGIIVEDQVVGDYSDGLNVPTPLGDVRVARSWGWVDAIAEGSRVRFVNTHTEAYDERVRNAQRDELLDAIGDPEGAVVLVGDFNAGPDRIGLGTTYVDAWLAAGGDPQGGWTCGQAADLTNETSSLNERIDYVWVRGATVEACRLIGTLPADRTPSGLWPSDHAGVVADVRLGER